MWDLIVSVPELCLTFYSTLITIIWLTVVLITFEIKTQLSFLRYMSERSFTLLYFA